MKQTKNNFLRLVALCLMVCMLLSAMAGCKQPDSGESQPTDSTGEPARPTDGPTQPIETQPDVTYTLTLTTESGVALSDVGIYVYTDETQEELVWFAKTDAEGKISFTDAQSESYIAVLANVPAGYKVEAFYPLTGSDTLIILAADMLTAEDLANSSFKLGDAIPDFTVTAVDGTQYTLKGLLAEKSAVVLNFWYVQCGPCKAEFPYLQEAYEQYSDKIAVIAMNPVNTDENEIAQFAKDMGLSFPVAKCAPEWEKAMGLTAYPTTVVIDRTGTVSLVHKGSVPDTKTFADTFAFFTADDYEPTRVENMEDLLIPSPGSDPAYPLEIGGVKKFEVTAGPGETIYVHLYKVDGMYLQIKDADASVTYKDKTYNAKNGKVSLSVTAPDTYTPAQLSITNNGSETKTFTVTLSVPKGRMNNPYTLELGEFTVKVSAGNDQGVYYEYKAPEDGNFTIKCLKSPSGVDYGINLYNLNSYAMRTLSDDGTRDEDGNPTITVPMKKGQKMQVSVGTLPDSTNSYPGGSFTILAEFTPAELEEEEKEEKLTYSVTVTDENGEPLPGVTVWVTAGEKTVTLTTNDLGVASSELVKGEYTASITIPEGYTAESNQVQLTAEVPAVTVALKKQVIVMVDYTVTVVDAFDAPVAGVMVIVDAGFGFTDENGKAVFHLVEGEYTAEIEIPEGYAGENAYAFEAGTSQLKITLDFKPGTENAPIDVFENPFTTESIPAGKSVYYNLFRAAGMILTVKDADAYIIYNGTTYTADDSGVVTVQLETPMMPMMPMVIQVGNNDTSAKAFTVELIYPVGSQMNPAQLVLGENTAVLEAGDPDGWFYTYTAEEDGKLIITMPEGMGWTYTLNNLTAGIYGDIQWSDSDPVVNPGEVTVSQGDEIQLTVNTYDPANMFASPAGTLVLDVAFEQLSGTQDNPTWLNIPEDTLTVAPGKTHYYAGRVNGMNVTILGENLTVEHNGVTYTPVDGVITLVASAPDFRSPAIFAVTNLGTEKASYTATFAYPVGEMMNPEVITDLSTIHVSLADSDSDGYYLQWTAEEAGTVSFKLDSVTGGVNADILLSSTGSYSYPTLSGSLEAGLDSVSMKVAAGDVVTVNVVALPDAQYHYPAADVMISGVFTADAPEEPDVPTDPTDPEEPSEPTDPSEPEEPSEPTDPSEPEEPTDPTDPEEPEVPGEMTYTVTVTDFDGAPVSGVVVRFMQDGKAAATKPLSGGSVTATLPTGEYAVSLLFSGTAYYYDQSAAMVSADKTELTIRLASDLADTTVNTEYYWGSFYDVTLGGTHVKVGADQANLGVYDGVSYCYFVMQITEPGIYRFSADSGAKLSFWGTNMNFVFNQTGSCADEKGVITYTIRQSNFPEEGVIACILGVEVTEGMTDTVLTLERVGDPEVSIDEIPWEVYEPVTEPEPFTLKLAAGQTITYMDLAAKTEDVVLVFSEKDGFYHLGSEDGPVIYVNLGPNARYISMFNMLGGGSFGGTAFRKVFYDEVTGAFQKKEDYTECMFAFAQSADEKTGLYPLNDDLIYMLQQGGDAQGWWNSESPGFLFAEVEDFNPELGWMFAVCTVE